MKQCSYCGEKYTDEAVTASDEYMYQGHIINDCENPDEMEKAFLNASPKEIVEVWL